MRKIYSMLKVKACMALAVMLLFGFTSQAQSNVKNGEQIEGTIIKIGKQINQALIAQKGITKQDMKAFGQYYNQTIVFDRSQLFRNIQDDSITISNTAAYVTIMVARYSAFYDQFKLIPADHRPIYHSTDAAIDPPWPGACNPSCDNMDFGSGTLAGWMACYSSNTSGSSSGFSYAAPSCSGILGAVTTSANDPSTATSQVSITSAGNDPVCGAYINQNCPFSGSANSVMVGDGPNPNYGVAILEQSFIVSAANCDFTYWYAVVLENPAGHTHFQQPYFNVYMYDQSGNVIPFCGNYSVTADSASAQGNFKGFYYATDADTCYCRPWTSVFVPLKKYIGQCVTIKVVTSDCALGGHFGYAYFAAKCGSLGIITSAPALCGKPIILTAPSGGAAYKWTSPGPGCMTPAAGNTQSITVNCPGKYTVIVYSYIGAACADTLDTTIVSSVGIPPVPDFKSDTVCAGNPTQFTNLTTGAGNTYHWVFAGGAGDTSDAVNPTYTYPAAGNYTATLTALNNGCGGDTTFTVVVNPPPTGGFTAPAVCLNNPTAFTNTSTGSTVYHWSFGDPLSGPNNASTAANPSHTYSACGTYNVVLAVGTAPCIDSVKQTVTVNPLPTPSFTATPVCLGQNTVLTDASTIGCGGTITGWAWNFGDPASGANNLSNSQDPTHVFSGTGTFNVLLTPTSNNGCQNSITIPVTIVTPPVANFTSGPVCLGKATTFTDKSTGTPVTWNWNFGDGTGTSTVQNPSYTYTAAGTYPVKLVVSSGAGCLDSITMNVTVNPPPVAAFTSTSVCQGTATAFTDASTGPPTAWSWNFGDPTSGLNNTSTLQNPTHIYTVAGTFVTKEVVTNASGCKDSITNNVTVNPSPSGTISITPECLGTATNFTCTTSMVGGTFAWNFGDGVGTSTLQNPTYTYTGFGSYNVYVVLTSASGCTDTAKGIAVVSAIPIANFTNTTVCQSHATLFTSTSTVAGATTITGWAWSFGDGGTATVANPGHLYAACGTYNVILAVTSSAGCTHDTTITVTVNPMPSPNFTGTNVCLGLTTTFTDASTIGCGGTITTWGWSFGDGGVSAIQNPTHAYAAAGTYTVTETVSSNNGCDSAIKIPVTVYPLPVPAFTNNTPCLGNPTNFTDGSTVAGGTIAGWGWSFGDGGTSTVTDPSHTYPSASTFPVTLVVVSNHGCVDSITKNVTVNPNPVPNFKANDTLGCAPMCVDFTDLSTVATPAITGWLWNFGDGSSDSSSTSQNPKHCYTKVGTFSVTLTVTTNNGCTETFTKVNYITTWPTPVANFSASPNPTTNTAPEVYFTDLSTGNPVQWTWVTFGDRTDSVEITENAQHDYSYTDNYQDTGTYWVQLDIVNKYGCKDSIREPVVIQPMWTFYVPNAFTPNGDGLNDGFIGKGIGIVKYEMWIFDRWGMLLYHCTDMQHPWDGTVQGTSGLECEEDTYVYLIDIVDIFKNSHRYVGRVSIIR